MFYIGSLFVLHFIGLVNSQEWTKLNCPAPRAPKNGVSFIFEDGLKVQYRCHPGFIMRGRHLSICRDNKWDNLPPQCVHAETSEDKISPSDNIAVSSFRNRFNWETDVAEPKPISITYGNGSNRLPLINGLWRNSSVPIDNRFLSVKLDSSLGHSVPPEQLVGQEVDIAALRRKLEQEVKTSRNINDRNEPQSNVNYHHRAPFYVNADGYVLGVSNSNQHPVYHLGAISDTNWNTYHKGRHLEPEMVELRRKQIEETRNIQMNTASKRQQNKFNNVVMYSSRDIPVWQGRIKPQNRYQKETIYKPTRVETNRYLDENGLNLLKSSTLDVETNSIKTHDPLHSEKFKILEVIMPTVSLLTEDVRIATLPTPFTRFLNFNKSENTTTTLPQTSTPASISRRRDMNININNRDESFEWPPEALWFKQITTPKPMESSMRAPPPLIQRSKTKYTTKKSKRRSSRRKNKQKTQKSPIVVFSHGRVKSTKPKKS